MTSPDLNHLRPPPIARVATAAALRLVIRVGLVFLLAQVWEGGANIAWWVVSVMIAVPLIMAVWAALSLVSAARTPYEKAIAMERLAAARFPFWPVVLSVELLVWVLAGRWLQWFTV